VNSKKFKQLFMLYPYHPKDVLGKNAPAFYPFPLKTIHKNSDFNQASFINYPFHPKDDMGKYSPIFYWKFNL